MTNLNITEEKILAAFESAGHEYLDMDDLVITQETISDFKKSSLNWAECAGTYDENYGGFNAVEFDAVQISKGQQRHALTVIDFGSFRATYN